MLERVILTPKHLLDGVVCQLEIHTDLIAGPRKVGGSDFSVRGSSFIHPCWRPCVCSSIVDAAGHTVVIVQREQVDLSRTKH